MRHNGGVLGGIQVPMWLADIGGGVCDGVHLVQNSEHSKLARTMFRKHVDLDRDLDRDIDRCAARFLAFET